MKIIDAHVHLCDIESFRNTAENISRVTHTPRGFLEGYGQVEKERGWKLDKAVVIGLSETSSGAFPDPDAAIPMEAELLPSSLEGTPFYHVLGINPHKLKTSGAMDALERKIRSPRVVGLKIYAGYYHYHVHDNIYGPVYDLAEQYKLPVILHMGDTYSDRGLLKFSHPLEADELAVGRRNISFIICHLAEPWVMTTAEVVMKNPNVYTDCSGIFVGPEQYVRKKAGDPYYMNRLKGALSYMEAYEKLLYGTDWPLAPPAPYVEFIAGLVPEEHWDRVFWQNAQELFPWGNKE